jgi:hypothetical protein
MKIKTVYGCPGNDGYWKKRCGSTKTICGSETKSCNREYLLIPRDKAEVWNGTFSVFSGMKVEYLIASEKGTIIWLPKGK